MYKANLGGILFFVILIIFSLTLYYSYFSIEESGSFFQSSYSYRGVKLIPENAPQLSNLFEGKSDSHNTFISSSECLKCHGMGMKIKGRMQAPQIAHNILDYCVSCHTYCFYHIFYQT